MSIVSLGTVSCIWVNKLHSYKPHHFIGQYHCPVTYKVFNDHSHIVAIKTTGNVFSNEVSVLT